MVWPLTRAILELDLKRDGEEAKGKVRGGVDVRVGQVWSLDIGDGKGVWEGLQGLFRSPAISLNLSVPICITRL